MRGSMARQTAIANNLANVDTPGFRGEIAEAQSLWFEGAGIGGRALASEEVVGADMRAGTITSTGRDLDVAMQGRSEEPTSELQSLMRSSYAVFCLKKKKT